MPVILVERAEILADFRQAARLGFVPAEAMIGRLHTNHCDALLEEQRQLGALELQLAAHLRRLDALFPGPVPPEPEPPTPEPVVPPIPPRPRHYGRLGGVFDRPGTAARH
jgi:hypothetical protein